MSTSNTNGQYEVLSPWAEVDPIPIKTISPRLTDLKDKTIGLFVNGKRAASPMLDVVEARLGERFPTLRFNRFAFRGNHEVVETENKDNFEEWIKEADAVITAVGD
ncbi:hypothetical protein ACFL7M_06585 [Thermodesulfobacteriota bacterium]